MDEHESITEYLFELLEQVLDTYKHGEPPNGEPSEELYARIEAAIRYLKE